MSVEIDEAATDAAIDAHWANDGNPRQKMQAAIRAYLSHQGDARAEVEFKRRIIAEADCARLREALKEASVALASSIEAMADAMNSGADFADAMSRAGTAQFVVNAVLTPSHQSGRCEMRPANTHYPFMIGQLEALIRCTIRDLKHSPAERRPEVVARFGEMLDEIEAEHNAWLKSQGWKRQEHMEEVA